MIEGLCRRLLGDDSAWIQESAAHALGQFGPEASGAGAALLRAAQTGEAIVREEALRALAVIQPAEAADALTAGMTDADPDVRRVASAGWMKAAEIPVIAIPSLVELRDPEVQVRANAAHALSRLETLPAEAIPLLIECAGDPSDGLRLNAVVALGIGVADAGSDVLARLIEDPNSRIRLIAAGAVLMRDSTDAAAVAVVTAALSDPALRLRRIGLEAVDSLGDNGIGFLDALRLRTAEEDDAALRDDAIGLLTRLEEAASRAAEAPVEVARASSRETHNDGIRPGF